VKEQELINALPSWGDADTPAHRDHSLDSSDILGVFVRTWPFLLPQILGYWKEFSLTGPADANSTDNEWSYRYVPLLVTLLALFGPLVNWQLNLLLAATVFITILIWSGLHGAGRL
jgi:hypothetical protein